MEQWQRVSASIDKTAKVRNRNGFNFSLHPLSSIMVCANCGARYYWHIDHHTKKGREYLYSTYGHKRETVTQKACPTGTYIKSSIETVFDFAANQVAKNFLETEKFIEQQTKEAERKVKDSLIGQEEHIAKMNTINKALNHIVDDIEKYGGSPLLNQRRIEREAEKAELQKKR